jgi:hypothetical protein
VTKTFLISHFSEPSSHQKRWPVDFSNWSTKTFLKKYFIQTAIYSCIPTTSRLLLPGGEFIFDLLHLVPSITNHRISPIVALRVVDRLHTSTFFSQTTYLEKLLHSTSNALPIVQTFDASVNNRSLSGDAGVLASSRPPDPHFDPSARHPPHPPPHPPQKPRFGGSRGGWRVTKQ